MDHQEMNELLHSYGADPDVLSEYHCQPIHMRIVRDVVKLRTMTGTWALKKVYMSVEQLEQVYQITEHVARAKKFSVPRFIFSRYGDPYVVHPSGLYYMTAWTVGRELDLRKESNLFAAVDLMARWHQAAIGFHTSTPSSKPENISERLYNGFHTLKQAFISASQHEHPGPFEKLLMASMEELKYRVEVAINRFASVNLPYVEETAKKYGSICHGNFTKKNILYDGQTYTVTNYDAVHLAPPVYDFALFLHRYMPAYQWNEQVLLDSIKTYISVCPPTDTFRDVLAAILGAPFRPLQIITWYVQQGVSWEEEDYVDAFELAMELEEARENAVYALFGKDESGEGIENTLPVRLTQFHAMESGVAPLSTSILNDSLDRPEVDQMELETLKKETDEKQVEIEKKGTSSKSEHAKKNKARRLSTTKIASKLPAKSTPNEEAAKKVGPSMFSDSIHPSLAHPDLWTTDKSSSKNNK